MRGVRALPVVFIAAAVLLPAAAFARGGGHHASGAGFGHGSHGAPGLTPQGRFGPSFGHAPLMRRPHFGSRVVLAAPVIVPAYYYGAPIYGSMFAPDAYAVPPVTYAPPPVTYTPPPVAYAPPPVAYPSPPPVAASAPPASTAGARVSTASAAPIYFCAELHAYTNELSSMACPGHWRRMTN